MTNHYGITEVSTGLRDRLRDYLEAQYHIRNENIIRERFRFLSEEGCISQRPYVELTPQYELGKTYEEYGLPDAVAKAFSDLSKLDVGVFERPYLHQANALTEFVNRRNDLVVSTGTGSGKTECFLFNVLASLVSEASQRPAGFKKHAVRSLILYPMNALVSDQLGRVRRLLGDERVIQYFRGNFGRHPLFGMYTSRTPYPGQRNRERDSSHVGPILKYYLELEERKPALFRELKSLGRLPAKDLRAYFGQENAAWDSRLLTGPLDAELFTRQEMQLTPPDLLITNYCMLEYMLLRPIERNLFRATREWLAADSRNEFILVLDEAHMYRGAPGAEVALLIRRLQSRLGIPREKLRCILTSASMGGGSSAPELGKRFAADLTGALDQSSRTFSFIPGVRETRRTLKPFKDGNAEALASFDVDAFLNRHEGVDGLLRCEKALRDLARALDWPAPDEGADERKTLQYLYDSLEGYEPVERIIQSASGRATEFGSLAEVTFPALEKPVAAKALQSLLALSTSARRKVPGRGERVLTPSRVHLFFRGLPPVYICIDPRCSARRLDPGTDLGFGRLYDAPRAHCLCETAGRVYELITHRECGAAFIRAYITHRNGDFLWHEQGGRVGADSATLLPIFLLIDQPNTDADNYSQVWIHIPTGRLFRTRPTDAIVGYLTAFEPILPAAAAPPPFGTPQDIQFTYCPVCLDDSPEKIMDLGTKGEQPFSNLVREMFANQPPQRVPDNTRPNGGRKVLLFSDGRQKAARLARDLPREVERDSFRQVIVLAADKCQRLNLEPRPYRALYWAFVATCSENRLNFFDQADDSYLRLKEHIKKFERTYQGDLRDIANSEADDPPARYKHALLIQLGHAYYSLHALCCAIVVPADRKDRECRQTLQERGFQFDDAVTSEVIRMWIRYNLTKGSFDSSLPDGIRHQAHPFAKPIGKDYLPRAFRKILRDRFMLDKKRQNELTEALADVMCTQTMDGERYIDTNAVKLSLALSTAWYLCSSCSSIQPSNAADVCWRCGFRGVGALSRDSEYLRARKSFWIAPVAAALEQRIKPYHLSAEEHTAQLSHRDTGVVFATTEKYELRFQDVLLAENEPPVDILSCTTTMEVGIDIGSLQAVGMRNVPPQRENYQQRSGRSGRRSSSVSVVTTFCTSGPHDMYYYANPETIISGDPRTPRIKIDNPRIATRHIKSFLLQTYFHEILDRTTPARGISNQLSMALGTTKSFFEGTGVLSLRDFTTWCQSYILGSSGPSEDYYSWLPDQVFLGQGNLTQAKKHFFVQTARGLLQDLTALGAQLSTDPSISGDDGLLDVLFDRGLLPTYAFPTDLCGFYIFGRDSSHSNKVIVKEKPEQGRDRALSEYAPGRTLVVNKKTYRVGGIYVHFADDPINRASELFENQLPVHVCCDKCGYVRDETDGTAPAGACPICDSPLLSAQMLTPPDFSPEKGRELPEDDLDQELSYATSAQFPMPTRPVVDEWGQKVGAHVFQLPLSNQKLVMVNRGPGSRGFFVCTSCGAAQPGSLGPMTASHDRPYLLEPRQMAQGIRNCTGASTNLILGHQFRTDLLVIRIGLIPSLEHRPDRPWVRDAFRTLSESVLLATTRVLDVDPSELNVGFRFLPSDLGSSRGYRGIGEIYLYDTLSGGAGYSSIAGERLGDILESGSRLLQDCPVRCEQSCTRCLRHYGNQTWQSQLDRHLGLTLLNAAFRGVSPEVPAPSVQARQLRGLAEFLRLRAIPCSTSTRLHGVECPLTLRGRGGRNVVVGTFPALCAEDKVEHQLHELDRFDDVSAVLLSDYVLSRDLPTAYAQLAQRAGFAP